MQSLVQLKLPVILTDQLHRRAGQIRRRGQDVSVFCMNDGFLRIYPVDGHVVGGILDFSFVHTQTGGRVCLGIKIAQQGFQSQVMECG